ncbi:hypothetical protein KKZ45_10375 [Enterobacter bugandensis]|uniref:hypothetical protein n=1 Tax=Enterobacter TaxID=547 RepID=UPI000F834FCE|nr:MULTISPECIES: hypothetical protein [Enterobacter]EGS2004337.1 hypothetical protein [Enterobacter cloacae]MBT2090650.1 hypothetical protein [Enterobacter bugandensis]RTQ02437.1 hypothetical protein EKN38_07795 [Enterobacter sp. WCHEn045836]
MGPRLPVDGDHADDDSVPDVESVIFVREMIGSIIYNVILRICMVNGRPRRGLWTALKKLDVLLSKKQPYGKIKILFKIKLAVVRHSIEQTLGFAGDPFGRMAHPIDQQSMADTVSGKGLAGNAGKIELTAGEATISTELEKTWSAAMPAVLKSMVLNL